MMDAEDIETNILHNNGEMISTSSSNSVSREEEITIMEQKESKVSSTTHTTTEEEYRFEAGDHVYQWCSVLGVPRVFQHHGIVLDVEDVVVDNSQDVEQILTIADFSNLLYEEPSRTKKEDEEKDRKCNVRTDSDDFYDEADATMENSALFSTRDCVRQNTTGSRLFLPSGFSTRVNNNKITASSPISAKQGGFRVYRTSTNRRQNSQEPKWHKVTYKDHWFHTHLWKRSGTCTLAMSDPSEVVLKRVRFLLRHSNNHKSDNSSAAFDDIANNNNPSKSSILPPYHCVFSNCECVAVWCKTGSWSTLQATSFLSHAAVGQVKGTATLAGIAATQTVTVPAAGFWGWLGYTSSVPLITVQPLLLPAICAYGAITVGGPVVGLAMAKSRWRKTTKQLNEALEAYSRQVAPAVS